MVSGVTLITGSNGGLGSRIVDYLLKKGVEKIACHYRSENNEILGILKSNNLSPENHLFSAELTSESEVQKMRKDIEQRLGPISNLVNLAGGSTNGVSWKLTLEDFHQVIDMNLTSTFICCREFIPGMRERSYGRIINTSSVVGLAGVAGASHYSAAKAGIIGLSKSMALELANKNITVNVLGLGYYSAGIIDEVPPQIQAQIKESIPLKRFGDASEIAAAITYLLDKDASYTTGQVLHINGGLY